MFIFSFDLDCLVPGYVTFPFSCLLILPMPGGSGQNHRSIKERSSGRCLAAAVRTTRLSGAEQWPRSGGSGQNHRSIKERSSGRCLAAAVRTTRLSGAEQWPRSGGSGQNHRSIKERSSGRCLAAAVSTIRLSGAEQWPMPGGSGQNHTSVRSGAMAPVWRQRTKPQVSQERSSDPGLAAPNRHKSQSEAEQRPMPCGSEQNHGLVRSGAMAHAWRKQTEPQVSQVRSSGPCLAEADRTTGKSGAEQRPMPCGSEQNHRCVRSGAMAHAWRKQTESQVSQVRSSGLCLAAANKTTALTGAQQ